MHNVDWKAVHACYLPLVQRVDDVLGLMASETSALHSFVYGGEYSIPEQPPLRPEWKGQMVTEILERDSDFDIVNGVAQYCPVSEQALRPTGQAGLKVGDVIVAVNGESVMSVPDFNMMLRGTAGRSIRLEVLRLQSRTAGDFTTVAAEPLILVPITTIAADALRYGAQEWRTTKLAKVLAKKSGCSVVYVHMRGMLRDDGDAFAQGFSLTMIRTLLFSTFATTMEAI
jgi:tricorn protease